MTDAIIEARTIIFERNAQFPANPFYTYAATQVSLIERRLTDGPAPDQAFYKELTQGIGLMCAREMEQVDMVFCDAVYRMLEQIRLQTL